MQVDVEIAPDASRTALDELSDHLFFPSLEEALRAVPKGFAKLVPGRVDPAEKVPQQGTCDCDQDGTPACPNPAKELGLANVKITHFVNPKLPDGTPDDKHVAVIGVEFGSDGRVGDLWLTRAMSALVAVSTVQAVEQYRFHPATCHGKPIASYLLIEIAQHSF